MYKSAAQRFQEIVKVLAYYGFGYIFDTKTNKEKKAPENLRKACEELGPTFIKIGQILSTRPDILPEPYISELSKLQDSVPPEPFEDINKVFVKEFLTSIDDAFSSIDKTPLASASIAQVYKATLKNGENVIVKIQRPDIAEKMKLDLSILYRIAKLTKARFQDSLINPVEALDELMASTEIELNFNNEVKNIKKFRENQKDVAFLYSPYVYEELSSKKVITMENIEGFKITDLKKLDAGGYDILDLSRKLVLSFFKQVFEDNFFHGDPHPGNILIREGKICYIDFGIMGSLSNSFKNALYEIIIAVVYKDIDKIISIMMSIGIKTGKVNRNKLYEDIDYLLANYFGTSLQNIKMSVMLQEVFEAAKRNNIRLPKDFTLLMRSLVIFEGVVGKINPDFNLAEVAIPYVKSKNKYAFLKNLNFDQVLLKSYTFVKDTAELPGKIIQLSDSVVNGRAKIQLEFTNLQNSVNELHKMVDRIVAGLILSAMIIGSSLILKTNVGPKIYDVSIIGFVGYGFAAIIGIWLIISMIKTRRLK